ncbi:MAG: choice-of-anchor Q domain-containing protein [Solirubrobacterales bacterium]
MSARRIRRARRREVECALKQEGREARRARLAAGATAALGAGVLFPPTAEAATFTVTSLEDDGSVGELRQAAFAAAGTPGDDEIVFQSGLTGTIELSSGPIDIYGQGGVDIQGPGASEITIKADPGANVFYISDFEDPDTPVRLAGLTLAGGSYVTGGAISSADATPGEAADLTIADSVLTGNFASLGGALFFGRGSLTITGSLLSDNEALYGGAIYAKLAEAITITDSAIVGNDANKDGAGLLEADGDVLVRDSSVAGNDAEEFGGLAIRADGAVTVEGSTFSQNTTRELGGGLALLGSGGPTVVQNSTISGNSATGSDSVGGGIFSDNGYDTPRTIQNSTVVGNSAASGGGIFSAADDGEDILELSSTIVAANTATESAPDIHQPDGSDGGFELGFSLVGSTSGAAPTETPAGSNLFGVDPQLGALASNGGPTQTHLPAATSPAIDHGTANGLATDQRGVPRTFDGVAFANAPGGDGTDIGAVEVQPGEGGLPGNAQCQGATVPEFKGTDGNDTLTGTAGPDFLRGLAGNDTANAAGGKDCVNGDAGKDNLKGGAGKDQLNGGAGKDKLSGQGGKDKLKGQGGKDKLKGGGGKDKLNGGAGKDKLSGGGGKDTLKGGGGKDKIKTGGGRDKVNCGGGKDKVTADSKDKVSSNCEKVVVKG